MSTSNSQIIDTVLIVISANIEGLTANTTSMQSEMYKDKPCHCLCLQETHRANNQARPKVQVMTLVAALPYKYGSAVFIRKRWSRYSYHKRWSCHSELKLLCKLCRTSTPPAMGARFTVFWACRPCGPAGWLALLLTKAGGCRDQSRSDNSKQESLDL